MVHEFWSISVCFVMLKIILNQLVRKSSGSTIKSILRDYIHPICIYYYVRNIIFYDYFEILRFRIMTIKSHFYKKIALYIQIVILTYLKYLPDHGLSPVAYKSFLMGNACRGLYMNQSVPTIDPVMAPNKKVFVHLMG